MKRSRWTLVSSVAVLVGLLALGGTPGADAQGGPQGPQLTWRDPRPRPALGMRVRLEILVADKPLPTVRHAGKIYLPVPEVGAEYTLRVCNDGPRRVVAILSVDGLSVLNGKPASEEHPGYVVAPFSHVIIPGWRRSKDTVAAF